MTGNKARYGSFLALWLLLTTLSIPALAQSSNATLNGTVNDPTGAVVPGADLILVNVATGAETRAASNDRGEFTFRNLNPGTYDLKVNKEGFQSYIQKGLILTINQIGQSNVILQVGATAQTVTVVGDLTAINFETRDN